MKRLQKSQGHADIYAKNCSISNSEDTNGVQYMGRCAFVWFATPGISLEFIISHRRKGWRRL